MLSLNGAAGCGGNFGGAGCLVVVVLAYWVMLELCNDRPSCAVLANPDTFTEDPCRGTSKYLETHYKCRPNQSDKHTVCEGEEMQIWCGEGDRIAVFTAMYGYVSNGTGRCAPNKQGHIECVAKEAISQVRYHCHGKKRCAIMANSSVFGEPCHRGINKYLTVTYACVPKRILKPLSIKSGSSSSKKKRKKKKQKKKRKKKKKKNKHKHDNKDRDEEDDDRLLPDLLPSPDEYPPESTLDTVYGTLERGEVTTYTSGKAPDTSTGNLALPEGTSSSSSTTTHKPSPSSTRASADPPTTQHDDISLSTPPSLSSWSSSPSSSSPSTTTTTTITTTTSTTTHRHHHRHGIDKFNNKNKNKNIQTEAPSTASTSKVDDETKRFLDESTIEPSTENSLLQTSSPDPSSGDSSVVPDTDTLNINSETDDRMESSTQNIPPQTSPDSGLEYSSVVPDNIILNNQNDGENGSFSSSPEGEEEAGKITTVPNSILDIITKGVQGDEETSPEQIRLGEGVSDETVDVVRTSREGEKDGVLKADNLTLNRGTSGDSSEDRDKSSSDSINNNDNNNSDDNNNDNIGRVKGNSESEPNEMTSRPVGSGNDNDSKNNNDNNSNNKNKQDSSSVDSKKNVHSYGDNGHAGGTDDVSGRGDKKDKDPVSMSERNATTICKNVTKENKNNNDNSFSNSPDSKNKVHSNGNGGKSKPKNKKNGSVLVSERNIAVICKNVSTSWGRDKPLDSRTIGFLKDWFSNIHFLEAHEEKAWLYFTLGICFGIIVILVVVLVKTCFNYRRNIRARLDVSEPTHRSANTNNHSSAMDTPMLEHSDSIDRIEVVRFSPRGTLRSMRSGSHNRDIVNYYG